MNQGNILLVPKRRESDEEIISNLDISHNSLNVEDDNQVVEQKIKVSSKKILKRKSTVSATSSNRQFNAYSALPIPL